MPDPMDTLQVPAELMQTAITNLSNPLAFGFMPILGEDTIAAMVKSVICSIADYLAEDGTHEILADRIDYETLDQLLPRHPYDRQNATGEIAAAVLHTIGVR